MAAVKRESELARAAKDEVASCDSQDFVKVKFTPAVQARARVPVAPVMRVETMVATTARIRAGLNGPSTVGTEASGSLWRTGGGVPIAA